MMHANKTQKQNALLLVHLQHQVEAQVETQQPGKNAYIK